MIIWWHALCWKLRTQITSQLRAPHLSSALNNGYTLVHFPIDQFHKSQNAPVPYPTMLHSEQKCAALCDIERVHSGICELDQFDWFPFTGADDATLYVGHETRLLGDLLNPTRYNKMAIPRFNSSTNVTVQISVVPVNLVELVCIKNSIMFYITPKYYDSRFVVDFVEDLGARSRYLRHG